MSSVYIFGSGGYFGSHFTEYFKSKGWDVITDRVDVRNFEDVKNALISKKPDVVLNCAGRTGVPNVDWCESHKEETMTVNVQGALNVICAASELNIYAVHVSSGCIYEGDNNGKGFTEEDTPNFYGSFYSRTKIYSEQALKEFNPLQLRVRIPIEGKSCSKNVINKLLNYDKIISVENSFTIIEDFLPSSYALIEQKVQGVFNMTNEGSMDHEFLMNNYTEIVDNNKKFEVMSLDDLNQITCAARSNCVLNTGKQKEYNILMPNIKQRIPEIMKMYAEDIA